MGDLRLMSLGREPSKLYRTSLRIKIYPDFRYLNMGIMNFDTCCVEYENPYSDED